MDAERQTVSRREFVQTTGAVVGGVAALALGRAAAAGTGDQTLPHAVLGRTGVEVSRLGMGCARFLRPTITSAQIDAMLHRAAELGVTYFDTSPNYGDEELGYSEVKMGPFVHECRDKIFLATKTEEASYKGTWKLLRQSMERLRTDHLDLVHLHNLGNESRFPDLDFVMSDKGAMGALREARKQGAVRFIGASGHLNPARFHGALDTGEIDVLMNAVNFVVQHVYDFEHKVWVRAHRQNIGLVAMKPLGGRGGDSQPMRLPTAQYEDAVRYALSVPGTACVMIGVESIAHVEQAVETVARFKPLTDEESHKLAQLGLELAGTEPWQAPYGKPTA